MALPFQIPLPWWIPAPPRRQVAPPERIVVDGVDWPLQVVRHRRARRYILRMTDAMMLRLTVPQRASLSAGLSFVATQGAWISREAERRRTRVHATPPEDRLRLRARAVVELTRRCEELAEQCGAQVARISIRNQRSRWGSCSSRGTIALNWRLVQMPPDVRDYVILHELMHLRQPNHSRAFWREVASVCPGWREAEAWLRRHGRELL